ncbi:MAG: helix-turn-helix transcriptional regulator [Thermoleophilia bacterium]|nr:helix-turn-helix transcriptional regulator [Thermoleophilia bacterium]
MTPRSTSSPIERLDDPRLVRALSHPLRVRILSILDEETASAVEIARSLRADIGVVAYHIRTLHRLGLLELVRETPRRGAIQRFYRALPRPQITAPAWADAAPISKQAHVAAALQQIHEIAGAANAVGGFDRPGSRFDRTVVKVDAEGLERLTGALTRVLDEIKEIEAQSAERQAGAETAAAEDVGLVMMVFAAPPGNAHA